MKKKNMLLACLLCIIPGGGLFYLGKKAFGIIVFIMVLLGMLLNFTVILALIGVPIIFITYSVAGLATIIGVIKYPGGWKWL